MPCGVYIYRMVQTYSSLLEYEIGRLIDEAISDEIAILANGNVDDIKDYKFRVGIIRGLQKARELMSEADHNIQSGERG
jgi:tRNA-dihydrouridine synthase